MNRSKFKLTCFSRIAFSLCSESLPTDRWWRSASLFDRHLFLRQIQQSNPRDRIAQKMPLHRPVVEGVIERRHNHRLVEHQPPMAYPASGWIDGIKEASL